MGDRALSDGESRRDLSDAAPGAADGNLLLGDGGDPRAVLPAELQHGFRAEHLRDRERIDVYTRVRHARGAPETGALATDAFDGEWQEWRACKSSARAR